MGAKVPAGSNAKEGYYVKCDQTTMAQNYIDNGWLICEVGVASIAPAEFVVFRIKFQLRSLHSCPSVGSEDGQVLIEHRSGQIIKYPLSDINFSVAVMAEKPNADPHNLSSQLVYRRRRRSSS